MFARAKAGALALLCAASFMAVVDTTIVSIALPSIRRELGFSTAGAQWVLNVYTLVFGGLLLLFGRVADLYGRKRVFEAGLVVFAVGSAVAGVAWDPAVLLAGRFVQGVGAAAFVPASLSLLTATFQDEDERSRAIGVYGAMAALGFVTGMVGGGIITELWGWRWVFFVNLPVALVMLPASVRLLDESRDSAGSRRVDTLGAVLVTSGLIAVIYAMTAVPEHGWGSAHFLVGGALGTALVAGFLMVETRHPEPLVPLRSVVNRAVLVPNGAIALQSMVGIAWLYLLTLYFQDVRDKGALESGLLFAPMTLVGIIAAPLAGRLVGRIGLRTTAGTGLVLVSVGVAIMIAGLTPAGPVMAVLAGMVVGEAGFMLSNVSLTVAGTAGLSEDRSGLAAGLLNTSIQLGSGWGLGIVAVVVAAALPGGPVDAEAYATALRWGLAACLSFSVLALALVVVGLRRTAVPVP